MSDQTKKYIKYFWYSILGAFGFFILLLLLIDFGVFGRMPDWEELENPRAALASEVISEDGAILGRYYLEENRTNASLNELHPVVVNALIATEDVRFDQHSGIDMRGLMRAVFSFGHDGGASTLTQQLAKNLFKRSKH